MGASTSDSMFSKYIRITAVVASYWIVSISMVFINKHLLSSGKIDAPLFVTCFQCVVTVILCIALKVLSIIIPAIISFPCIKIDLSILKSVSPLSVIFVCMITFNNLCLKHVGVSFYYVGRSLTTVFNVVLTFMILHQRVSGKAIICCAIIVFGFALGVNEEGISGSLSINGVLYGILASVCVSLYSIYMKKTLPLVDGNIWRLNFYTNINAIVLFLPLMLIFGEFPVIMDFESINSSHFWMLMVLGGIFGFAIGYVTGLQIKVTSPLTHNISGTAKACVQTVFGVAWFHEQKSTFWWISNYIVLLGSAAYTRVRQLEMQIDHQRLPTNLENKKLHT